jgi:hypothetical protein
MLTNFRIKQKQKFSRNTQLSRAYEIMREINIVHNVRKLFFVMFVNVVLCVDALMLGVFDSIQYIFLFWCYFY